MKLTKTLSIWFTVIAALGVISILILAGFFIHIIKDLPDYKQLEEYDPPGITRFYDAGGNLINEYAHERRIYVKYDDIPKVIIEAFISAEDKNFFNHAGVDFYSIFRASIQNILNVGKNRRLIGGSTITQQVVKDFLLSNERTLIRKLKEAILAYRISKIYSKERILELYLNQIYLGNHSYGIAAAAQNYFCKNLSEIDISESALLASLPKAPSYLNPYKNYDKALARRDWVIDRLYEEQYITEQQATEAEKKPISLKRCEHNNQNTETFYSEAVRQEVMKEFGEDAIYKSGLIVNTNIDTRLQSIAEKALQKGLEKFDKKLGWRGKIGNINLKNSNINQEFKYLKNKVYTGEFEIAAVTKISDNYIEILTQNNQKGKIYTENLKWVLKKFNTDSKGSIKSVLQKLFKTGDAVLVSYDENRKIYKLEQIPEVNGAIVVLDVKSSKILAMVGGYDMKQSSFNRATQAHRQPGSLFKTFVYLSALEEGIAPNTLILDEPLSVELGHGLPNWEPRNYGNNFMGLITMRKAFEKSRNIPTIRLLLSLGLDKVLKVAKRYELYSDVTKPTYSMALGSFETTLLNITNAYASIANGGLINKPKLVNSIYNRRGHLLYKPKGIDCYGDCDGEINEEEDSQDSKKIKQIPKVEYIGKATTDSASNYQLLSMLEGSVMRGTSRRTKVLKRTQGGKTGTTNDSYDAWYIGFTPDIAVGVFVGYDVPKSLGKNTSGATVALPIYVNFMKAAEKYLPDRIFNTPPTVQKALVEYETGQLINSDQDVDNTIDEYFKNNEISELEMDLSGIKGGRKLVDSNNYNFDEALDQIGKELQLNSEDESIFDFIDKKEEDNEEELDDSFHGVY